MKKTATPPFVTRSAAYVSIGLGSLAQQCECIARQQNNTVCSLSFYEKLRRKQTNAFSVYVDYRVDTSVHEFFAANTYGSEI